MNEQKNLLLAIVASLIILLIFQYFFPNKPDTQKENTVILMLKMIQITISIKYFLEKKL